MARGSPLHHMHLRKRVHKTLEPYPHPNTLMRWLDRLILSLAILGPMANIPQIWKIFAEKNTAGLSLTTWSIFVVITIPWIIYGIVHKEKPIIVANILWFTTQLIVTAGIIIYPA